MMGKLTLNGIIYWFLICWSGTSGVLVLLVPLLPLIFMNKRLFRYLVDQWIALFITFTVALLELVYGTKFIITGDPISLNGPSLMVLNHRTRLDWMFYWACLYRYGYQSVVQFKLSMKYPLKSALSLGWACQFGSYLFLKRKLDLDSIHINNMFNFYKSVGTRPQLVFFPEGINRDASGIERSRKFALDHELPEYQHVLHPHTAGFAFILNELKQAYGDVRLYDVTLAYPDHVPEREIDLLQGRFPRQVHYHIESYNSSDLPSDNKGLQEFCSKIWHKKEERLEKFFSAPKDYQSFDSQHHNDLHLLQKYFLYLVLVFWVTFSLYTLYLLFANYIVTLYYAFAVSIIVYIHIMHEGIDVLQLNV